MGEHKRLLYLILLMATVSLVVAGTAVFILYETAFEESRERLVETAQSQARLIEAVARFDAIYSQIGYPGSPSEATLSQITDAHKHYKGFGETGEFTLARREDDSIVFLLRHRHSDLDKPKPVSFDSKLAEPMRRALSGLAGTVIGSDYRGEEVLAAYEPVEVLDLGIVAKIDLAEIRAPFLEAGYICLAISLLFVLAGSALFAWITNPMIRQLLNHTQELGKGNEQLQQQRNDLDNRVKELDCLFGISKFIEQQELSLDELLQRIVEVIPIAWQYPEITCARITLDDKEFKTEIFDETIWKQTTNITAHGMPIGVVEVYYLQERPEKHEGPFLEEERSLIEAIAERLGRMTERKWSEERIRTLSQELMKAQEIARQKLACDLHDNLAQDLSTLKIGLATLYDDQPDISPDARQRVSELSKGLQHSITTVRDMAYNLHPASLEELGLVQTIHRYCEEFSASFAIESEVFSVGIDSIELDFDTEISVYRLVQEGLNNVRKHSEASHVIIRLSLSFPYIMLSIEDNGKGFDVEKHSGTSLREKRMGLRSMEQRVAFLDGTMKIESRPTLGTRILAKIPYTEKTNG